MQTAAFFDMDGTLLRGESQLAFLLWCWRRGIAPPFRSLRVMVAYSGYLFGISRDAARLRRLGFGLFTGLPVERLENAGEEFFRQHLVLRLRRQASALIQAHRELGHQLVLVTSASEPVARPVAAKLNVDTILATRLVSRGGRYTGDRELPEPYGEDKRTLVERFCAANGVVPEKSFAYSDHHSDRALLEFVGHPVVVHPSRMMRQIALERHWKITSLDGIGVPDLILLGASVPC